MRYVLSTVFYTLCMLHIAKAQIEEWQVDPSGKTQYQVPKGWQVDVQEQSGVYMWQAKEELGNDLSPDITIMAMANFPESRPELFIEELKKTIQGFTITKSVKVSENESHYKAKGQLNSQALLTNFMFLRDVQNNVIYLASFSAPQSTYGQMGGANILYTALKRVNPFQSTTPTNTSTISSSASTMNMQSLEVQGAIMLSAIDVTKQMLTGAWLQAFSYQTENAYQGISTGSIQFGERGYGHLITFKENGTYQLTYRYKNLLQGCVNEANFVEKGLFEVKGKLLTLTPTNYQGKFNVCGQVTPETNNNPPKRVFNVYMDQSKSHLVIKGKPMKYTISTETDQSGQLYLQEGFNKVN